jgi:hypothetical protein
MIRRPAYSSRLAPASGSTFSDTPGRFQCHSLVIV